MPYLTIYDFCFPALFQVQSCIDLEEFLVSVAPKNLQSHCLAKRRSNVDCICQRKIKKIRFIETVDRLPLLAYPGQRDYANNAHKSNGVSSPTSIAAPPPAPFFH